MARNAATIIVVVGGIVLQIVAVVGAQVVVAASGLSLDEIDLSCIHIAAI